MRKAQKKQAEDFLGLLNRVHEEIKKLLEQKKLAIVCELLEQCQQGAILLGNMIEQSEGEGFVTVSLLEDYCELMYQIHEQLVSGETVNGGKVYKSLQKLAVQMENSIKNDIKVRREAVFLPYKASMWDSLESVWMAAKEDEGCDAYVVPIPYYDKKPDGSFGIFHYEGDLYPDYVPVTNYEDYDFKERRPDMIFIHNPYDEYNYVTSVEPLYYSKNLKQYTDKLIYIPYFVLGEVSPDDEAAVEGMAHFCTVPAVLHADKVIVQSEDMRQVYIKVMTKATNRPRAHWEKKILGLGSPKVDKVLNTRKEDLDIPKEWLGVIEKPDGSWKKVILYNTGVSGLLHNSEKMLIKIRDVFRIFKEYKDEVALLWRPHPLIPATISSMRPALWETYQKIVVQYQNEGWGIYDDTADIDRAIVLSDAYYGDESSVVQLCKENGMPIMFHNVNAITLERDKDMYNKIN